MRRKEERSKQGQTNNKAEQHSTPKAVIIHVLMRDERRREERSKQSQTNNKVKQHMYSTCRVNDLYIFIELHVC